MIWIIHNVAVIHQEPDILEREVKWASGSIRMNEVSGDDGIPGELFQIGKNWFFKVLHAICHQIWKARQWPQDWKRSVFIPIPKKDNATECYNCRTIVLISQASKIMLKTLQTRLQQYVNQELPGVQAGFRNGWGTRDQIANICWVIEKATERQWHPTPVLFPGKSHGWRSLAGCSPWGLEEPDTNKQLHFHLSLSGIGERNGNPLQCPCLEIPRDGGAWWAAIYEVAQSRTRWKPLSSSSRESKGIPEKSLLLLH